MYCSWRHTPFRNKTPEFIATVQSSWRHTPFRKLDRTEFFGTLTIVDAEKFSEIIGRGIGGGCAFGFGAMILPQVMK